MRQKTYLLIFFLIYTFIYSCKNTEIKSQWQERTIKIDGDNSDWGNTATEYLKDVNAAIGICNDDQNLYVLFRFSDENLARKILSKGLVIFFSKDIKSGIRYRGNFALAESLRSNKALQFPAGKRKHPSFPVGRNLGMITVFSRDSQKLIQENNDSGLKAAALFYNGVFS